MLQKKIFKFILSFISKSCDGFVFAGYWSIVVSFFQANMWHFTEPNTSGFSLFPLIMFGVCIVLPTIAVLLPIQVITQSTRNTKVTSIAYKIVYVTPLILLFICELPVVDLWIRTSCLCVAVIILQICSFYPQQFHGNLRQSSSNGYVVAPLHCVHKQGTDNTNTNESHANNNCQCSSESRTTIKHVPQKIVSKDLLLGMLIVISVRWAYLSVNVFYECWLSGVIILSCSALSELCHNLPWIIQKCKRSQPTKTRTPEHSEIDHAEEASFEHHFLPAILMANGVACLLHMSVWTISSPAFLSRWCGINSYPIGIVIPTSFLVGVVLVTIILAINEMCDTEKKSILLEIISLWVLFAMLVVGFSLVIYMKTIVGGILICISLPYIIHHHVTSSIKFIKKINKMKSSKTLAALKSISVFVFGAMVFLYYIIYISFQNPKYLAIFHGRFEIIVWMQLLSIGMVVIFTSYMRIVKRKARNAINRTGVDSRILDVLVPVIISILVFSGGVGGYIHLMRHRCEEKVTYGQVKVLTWNILLGHDLSGRNNLGQISDVIKQQQPDVVGLQEADPWHAQWGGKDTWSYLKASLGDCYHQFPGDKPDKSLLGIGLLSKDDAITNSHQILPTNNESNVPLYGFNKITLEIKTHQNSSQVPLHVYTLHAVYKNWTCPNAPPHSVLSCQQMHAIADDIDKLAPRDPVIVMGDFNINPNEPELDLWFDEDFGFQSALTNQKRNLYIQNRVLLSRNSSCFDINQFYANFTRCNENDYSQQSTIHNRHAHVDHIFYRGLKLLNASILNINFTSDHKPLVAEFSLL